LDQDRLTMIWVCVRIDLCWTRRWFNLAKLQLQTGGIVIQVVSPAQTEVKWHSL
jgi:hypothetical protein